jgi:hypothetical protein
LFGFLLPFLFSPSFSPLFYLCFSAPDLQPTQTCLGLKGLVVVVVVVVVAATLPKLLLQ